MDDNDSSTVSISFPAASMAKGWCYKLSLNGGPVNFEHSIVKNDLEICASNCDCDWVGTSHCEEQSGVC